MVTNNVDTTASLTITAGTGTLINGAASLAVGPNRSVTWVYDDTSGTPTWRSTLNGTNALLATDNLSNIASPAVALAALGGASAAALSAATSEIPYLSTDMRAAYLKLAALSFGQLNSQFGVVDPLNNLTDINTSASSNYTYDGLNFLVRPTKPATAFLTVSTGSQAISDSSFSGSYLPANAFDGSFSDYWAANTSTAPSGVSYIGQDFGAGNAYALSQILFYNLFHYWAEHKFCYTSIFRQRVGLDNRIDCRSERCASVLNVIAVPSSAGSHRAWRLLANANTSSGGWAVPELEFQISIPVGTTVSNASQAISGGDYNSTQAATDAFNGNFGDVTGANTTYWASVQSGAAIINAAYIGQDFGVGNAYAISEVLFYGAGAAGGTPTSMALQYADTAGAYTTAVTVAPNTNAGAVTAIAVPTSAGSHRFWRLIALAAAPAGVYFYAGQIQMQIAGTLATVSNAAQAIVDSTYSGQPASNAFDFNTATWWQNGLTANQLSVAYIGQDFGSGNAYPISQILLTNSMGPARRII